MKSLLLFLSFISFGVWAQPVIPTSDYVGSLGTMIVTPLFVTLDGDVKLNFSSGGVLNFPAIINVGYSQNKTEIILPKDGQVLDRFEEAPLDAPKIRTIKKTFEGGFGAGVSQPSIGGFMTAGGGLTPFAGALWQATNVPDTKLDKDEFWHIPDNTTLWNKWSQGEARTYQVFGGLRLSVGVNVSIANILSYSHSYQGRYDFKIEKLDNKTAFVRVRRENWDKDSLSSGALIITAQVDYLKFWDRERHFILDMTNENHMQALTHLRRGNLIPLQTFGVNSIFDERNFWVGNQQSTFVGIPLLAGKVFARSMLQKVDRSGEGKHLWMLSKYESNLGFAIQARTERSILTYQPKTGEFNSLLSFERNKTTAKTLKKEIFDYVERMSNQTEEFNLSSDKLGYGRSVLTTNFKVDQVYNWIESTQSITGDRYKEICTLRKLACAKKMRAHHRIKRIKKFVSRILKSKKSDHQEKMLITFVAYLTKRPALWAEVLAISNDTLNLNFSFAGSLYYPYRKDFQVPAQRLF